LLMVLFQAFPRENPLHTLCGLVLNHLTWSKREGYRRRLLYLNGGVCLLHGWFGELLLSFAVLLGLDIK